MSRQRRPFRARIDSNHSRGLLLAGCLLLPTLAQALALGPLHVRSALDEPLDAEIELLSVRPGDLKNLKVHLSTQALQGNLDAKAGEFDYRLINRQGRHFLELYSQQAISEPLLNFLVEVSWPNGRLLRELPIFLDPATSGTAMRTPVLPEVTAPPNPPPSQKAAPQYSTAAQAGARNYGPVRRGETLWAIARETRPVGVSMQQMMQAIYQANRKAFARPSLNSLMAGVSLRIPTVAGKAPRAAAPPAAVAKARTGPVKVAQRPQPPVSAPAEVEAPPEVRLLPPDQPASGPSAAGAPPAAEQVPPLAIETSTTPPGAGGAQTPASPAKIEDEVPAATPTTSPVSNSGSKPAIVKPATTGSTQPTPATPTGKAATNPGSAPPEPPATPVKASKAPAAASASTSSHPVAPARSVPPAGAQPAAAPLQAATPAPATGPAPAAAVNSAKSSPKVANGQPAANGSLGLRSGGFDPVALLIQLQSDPAAVLQQLRSQPLALPIAGGALVVLLVLLLLIRGARRRRSERFADDRVQELFGALPERDVPRPPIRAGTDATAVMSLATPTSLRSSRLDRVGFLLAAGSYAEAEKLLRLAQEEEPDNPELSGRLLDVYRRIGDREPFIATAETLHQQLHGNETSPLWQRARELGQQLCPDHPLFNPPAAAAGSPAD